MSKLVKKLVEKKALKVRPPEADIPDIEDAGDTLTKSPYFSPVQTRQQRKVSGIKPVKELEMGPSKKKARKFVTPSTTTTTGNSSAGEQAEMAESSKQNKIPPWEPKNWQQILENIRTMRSRAVAPVDSMGCHKCSDDAADEKTQRYQKLVALMLSSQTKDETTFEAMQRLKQHGLTPTSVTSMDASKLEALLCPVSFYKNKAKYLRLTSRILIDKYDADIPNNTKELIALPGVGPKMAHICMATAWNTTTGIGVDVHVHRITNRLNWVPKTTKEPEQTRIALENWLPRELWREVNHLLVGFGQTVCTPVRPHCGECLNRDICPAADKTAMKTEKALSIEMPKFQKKILI